MSIIVDLVSERDGMPCHKLFDICFVRRVQDKLVQIMFADADVLMFTQ